MSGFFSKNVQELGSQVPDFLHVYFYENVKMMKEYKEARQSSQILFPIYLDYVIIILSEIQRGPMENI